MVLCVFFFFKQKTAYEIYQCDWSSDVCSSDLGIKGIINQSSNAHRFTNECMWSMRLLNNFQNEGSLKFAPLKKVGAPINKLNILRMRENVGWISLLRKIN